MTVRARILQRSRSVSNPKRRPISEAIQEAPGAQIVPHDGPDEFVLSLLKECPPKYSHHRAGEYLHVSDLVHKCIRKIALAERFKVQIAPERLSDSQEITFAQGSCIGDYVVNRAIHGHPAKVYGKWKCNCGETVTKEMTKEQVDRTARSCPTCNSLTLNYVELNVRNDEYLITGNIDLTFQLRSGALYPVELKSIAHEAWKELARPQPAHVVQASSYWWLMREEGRKIVDQASILYVTKGFVFTKGGPYKEFTFKPSEMIHRLDDYLADAKARKISMEGGPLPPRVVCSTEQSPDAKKCTMCSMCFGVN